MSKLTVVSVDPFGGDSASVTLRSDKAEIVVFCWPCTLKAGDVIDNRLVTLDANTVAAYFSDWPEDEKHALSVDWIQRVDPSSDYAYRGRGRVIDQDAGLVEVQGFVIEMDVPYDGYVDFEISRVDVQ